MKPLVCITLLSVCWLRASAQQTDFGGPVLRSIDPTPTPSATPRPTPRPAPTPAVLPPSAPTPGRLVQPQAFDPIQHVYLDPDSVYLVRCQTNIVTTIQFPDPVQSMDGKGFARTPEESKSKGALFFLSHVANSNVLSVNPLADNVSSNLNVVMDGDVYVLVFASGREGGFYKVKLQRRPPPPGPPPGVYGQVRKLAPSPNELIDTITLCKGYALLKDQHPELVDDIVTVYPDTLTDGDGFKIRNLGIYRKDRFDALVFECELINRTDQVIYYDPSSFSAGAGSLLYHVTIPDASGEIPPHGKTSAWFLFQGDDFGGSANLDPRNDFHLSLKRTSEPVPPPAAVIPVPSANVSLEDPTPRQGRHHSPQPDGKNALAEGK